MIYWVGQPVKLPCMSDLVIPGNSPACNRSEYCHKKIPSAKRWDILVSIAGPLVEGGAADWLAVGQLLYVRPPAHANV
jgi:hypothetical protein